MGQVVDRVVEMLIKKGAARIVHLGVFKVSSISGRKRYDFKKREMVPVESFKIINFKPARGLQILLNGKRKK